MKLRHLPVVAVLGCLAGPSLAQDAPAPTPCDPAVRPCLGVSGWMLTVRTWTPGGAEPEDLIGARLQAELRWASRWRAAVRGDATGIPGTYKAGDWQTVRSFEGHGAVAYDALRLPGGVTLGPAAGVGAAVIVERDEESGAKPRLPQGLTAGLGARASWPGGWVIAVAGVNQALHGFAGTATWEVEVSDRVASVGTAAVGSRTWTMTTGIGVRFK